MKAYFYCRVAHDDSFSLERQAEELRRYAEQAGYTIVGAAAEHGSGMTLDRPALQEVMEAVLAGKVDVVLISSLDRIGRDWGMTKHYIDLLTEHKVKLLCVRERMMHRQLQLFTIFYIKKQSVHYRILRSYKDTLHGRSVGIQTRGLLVPKVGRIFLADISRHFRTFLLRKFRSFVVSSTDNST